MSVCPTCFRTGPETVCPDDGSRTIAERFDLDGSHPSRRAGVRDRYLIEEFIGQGSMGWVFRAHHRSMGMPVALKILRRKPDSPGKELQRFAREVRICSRLRHPNTIRVFDCGISNEGYVYLVMELLVGRSLAQVLKDGPLPPAGVMQIALQVSRSLHEAHLAASCTAISSPRTSTCRPSPGGRT